MNDREVDKLIHTKIMGYPGRIAFRFTEDISWAWKVVEKLKERYRVSIHSWGDGWQCALEIKDGKPRYPGMDIAHNGDVHAEGEIAMAISLAALKTIEATQKEKT